MQHWCGSCYSMGSTAKIENVRALLSSTIAKNVPGDFAEAGTWRGGMGILARAVQWSAGEARHRRVYVSDSFGQGLPSNTTMVQVHQLNTFRATLFYPMATGVSPTGTGGGHVGFGAAQRRRAEAIWGGGIERLSTIFF